MATEYLNYIATISQGWYSNQDPEVCPCRGNGWILSDLDTWVQCPLHPQGPHPEMDSPWEEDESCEEIPEVPPNELREEEEDPDIPF
jgi:hypothetical protein